MKMILLKNSNGEDENDNSTDRGLVQNAEREIHTLTNLVLLIPKLNIHFIHMTNICTLQYYPRRRLQKVFNSTKVNLKLGYKKVNDSDGNINLYCESHVANYSLAAR